MRECRVIWKIVAAWPRRWRIRSGEKREGTGPEKTWRKKTRKRAWLCRETAVLGGDAVARVKVRSRRWWRRRDRGYETAFLKMRVEAHLLRREVEGEEKVDCEDCGKKRPPWDAGRRRIHRGCEWGKASRGGERIEQRKEWVRIELILFHEPALLPFTAIQLLAGHPFRLSNPVLFIYQPSCTWGRVKDVTSFSATHSRRFAHTSSPFPLLVILRYWRHFFQRRSRVSVPISQR